MNRFYNTCKRIYTLMLRIQKKLGLYLNQNQISKNTNSENKNSLNLKSNIYLGKVGRVEPSLQAAFIDFGRDRHGFLAFNDIQSDYYEIPTEDKELKKAEEKIREDLKESNESKDGTSTWWRRNKF